MQYPGPFDASTATEGEILDRAKKLVHQRPLNFLRGAVRERSATNKGNYGFLVEEYFGIRANSESAPDFGKAGIELKVVPILKGANGKARTKERTVVSMIDFMALLNETWETARVRKKLHRILFVFYHHDYSCDLMERPVIGIHVWSPDEELGRQLEKDWTAVFDKVAAHQADQISESDGEVLGACTKAADSSRRRPAPGLPGGAKPRAWSLKPAYTTFVYSTHVNRSGPSTISVLPPSGAQIPLSFEETVLRALAPLVGKTIREVAARLGRTIGVSKASQAWIVRHALGVINDRAKMKEFEERGVQIKTVPCSSDWRPWEAMSFAGFRHMLLEHEDWESSALRQNLERLLIVPLQRPTRQSPRDLAVLRQPFFWTPTEPELTGIQAEWEEFRRLIIAGQGHRLPTAQDTKFIHVRPKARDSSDTEPAPGGLTVVKKSFWLNQDFVRDILVRARSARSKGAVSPPSIPRD